METTFLSDYEQMLWTLLCRPDLLNGRFSKRNIFRISLVAYGLYYRGFTLPQIYNSGFSKATSYRGLDTILRRHTSSDVRCSIMAKSSDREPVEHLSPLSECERTKILYVHKATFQDHVVNVYELSDYALREGVYGILELPLDILGRVDKELLNRMVRVYRNRKSLSVSREVMHTIASNDVGIHCFSVLHTLPFLFRTECRLFENGEFMSAYEMKMNRQSLKSTAQIADAYLEFQSLSRFSSSNFAVFVEQDMGTQSGTYLRTTKLVPYMNLVRFSFRKDTALVTLLFTLHTSSRFNVKRSQTSSPSVVVFHQSLCQEITARSYESFGDTWQETPLADLRSLTISTKENCPSIQSHLQHEIDMFDRMIEEDPAITIGKFLSYSSSSHKNSDNSLEFSSRDIFYYKKRRDELFREALSVDGLREELLNGLSICCIHNKQICDNIACLIPELSPQFQGISTDIAPHSTTTERVLRIARFYFSTSLADLQYEPFIRSDGFTFRNHYFNESASIHILIENISDDLGGRTRVLNYLNNPLFAAFRGYLVCLVSDDWLDETDAREHLRDTLFYRLASSAYAHYLIDEKRNLGNEDPPEYLHLTVCFITYSDFAKSSRTSHINLCTFGVDDDYNIYI